MVEPSEALWYVEEGIGETRAIRIQNGEIVAARLDWPGGLAAGQVEDAQLVSRTSGSPRGTARFSSGEEALVDGLPRDASEGAVLRLKVLRSAIGEAGRTKLAQARPTTEVPNPAPTLTEALEASGEAVRGVRTFPVDGWEELMADAFAREVAFEGGSLLLSPTPAMTLIDVDGTLAPANLALAAVPAIASTLQRFDMGGSIGIDFPTLAEKADRRAVDQALAKALEAWPHERTAMNGFGFVQIVARLSRPSILQRVTRDRVGAAARLLLRRGEKVNDPGALLLTCHPAVKAKLQQDWLTELATRTGRQVRIETDPGIAPEAGFAQSIPL